MKKKILGHEPAALAAAKIALNKHLRNEMHAVMQNLAAIINLTRDGKPEDAAAIAGGVHDYVMAGGDLDVLGMASVILSLCEHAAGREITLGALPNRPLACNYCGLATLYPAQYVACRKCCGYSVRVCFACAMAGESEVRGIMGDVPPAVEAFFPGVLTAAMQIHEKESHG